MNQLRLKLRDAMRSWGGTGVTVFAALCSLTLSAAALFIVYTGAPAVGIDTQPSEVKVVPASGPEGFPVEVFCKDDATQVKAIPNPDADGITYQLMRVRDRVPEAVVWASGINGDNLGATYYWYDDQNVQQSRAAVVTPGARRCIEDKAK